MVWMSAADNWFCVVVFVLGFWGVDFFVVVVYIFFCGRGWGMVLFFFTFSFFFYFAFFFCQ